MNSKNIVCGLIGLAIGTALTAIAVYSAMPGLMIIEDESRYGFDETVARVHQGADEHGWKIPTVHDLQETMKKIRQGCKQGACLRALLS